MFARPVAKPKATTSSTGNPALRRVAPLGHRHGDREPALGEMHHSPLAAERGPGLAHGSAATARPSGSSWNFANIPAYPPGRREMLLPMPHRSPAPRFRLQAKLDIGAVDDPLEREADRVADQVMRMSDPGAATTFAPPQVSRICAACEDEHLHRAADTLQSGAVEAPASVHEALRSPAQPLNDATRAYFEPRFGRDLSGVRVHAGAAAAQSARDVCAYAYTVGHDIVFAAGQFTQDTHEGRRLLAHELTHVVQQLGVDTSRGRADDGKNGLRSVSTALSSLRLQRDPDPDKSTGPVLDLKQNGDVWELKLDGITDVTAAKRRIWPSGVPSGVSITLIRTEGKPANVGLFKLTGLTLKAIDSMASPFPSWFATTGISWSPENLKKLLDTCDGGLGIWGKAKKANKNKDPKVILGDRSNTDSATGEITLDRTTDQCHAVQALVHELSNLASLDEVNKVIASASAGDLSRDDFIKALEKIEYNVGVKNVLTAFDACKDKWLCRDSIMEFARKAKNFDEYFQKHILPAHKENYGQEWDKRFKKAYDDKHRHR